MQKIDASDVTDLKREVSTKINLDTISLEAIKKSCYRFSDSYFYRLDLDHTKTSAIIVFRVPVELTNDEVDDFLQDFHRDSLDQDLREIVSEKTEVVRNLILLNAFANTDLIEQEGS